METIKKFSNRKLYSNVQKKYVTLNYLIDKIRNKEDFQVVEHGTNVNVTAKTLRQALASSEVSEEVVRKVLSGEI